MEMNIEETRPTKTKCEGMSRAAKRRKKNKKNKKNKGVNMQEKQNIPQSTPKEQTDDGNKKQKSIEKESVINDLNVVPPIPETLKKETIECIWKKDDIESKQEGILNVNGHQIALDGSLASDLKADLMLDWLLNPIKHKVFFEDYWEENPIVVQRESPNYFDGWFSSQEIKKLTQQQVLKAGDDLELLKYEQGRFQSFYNDAEDANIKTVDQKEVWAKMREDGFSVSFRCAVKFSDSLWRLLSTLEEAFGTRLGCWATLSPPGAQARPPHNHNYHSLVMQLEGHRRWHLWPPGIHEPDDAPNQSRLHNPDEAQSVRIEELPREPVDSIPENELPLPQLQVELAPGDVLYLPPGYIHKARTIGEKDSLHLSLSFGHENAYADFLEMIVPEALGALIQECVDVRRSLPRSYLDTNGVMHMESQETARTAFRSTVKGYLERIMSEAENMIDAAADQFAKRFISDKLPPPLTQEDEAKTSSHIRLHPDNKIRLVSKSVCRLVVEEGKAVLYHAMDNARSHHEAELNPLEFELDDAPAIEALIKAYPGAIKIEALPHPPAEDLDDKMDIAKSLFNEGFVVVLDTSDHNPLTSKSQNERCFESVNCVNGEENSIQKDLPPLDDINS